KQAMTGVVGHFSLGAKTANANTAIVGLIPPNKFAFTRLMYVIYNCGSTAHTLRFMKCVGRTTLASAAASGQAVGNLAAQPSYNGRASVAGNIATSDYGAVRLSDGSIHFGILTVSTLAVTFGSSLPVAAAAGADFWTFGAIGEAGHAQHLVTASKARPENEYSSPSGIFGSDGVDEPLLIYSNNASNAGTIEDAYAHYVKMG